MNDRSTKPKDKPVELEHPGFDVEATRRAQATAERAREVQAGKGEHADEAYVEEGPREAARRMGSSEESVKESVERARDQA